MRRLVLSMVMSLDGFIEGPNKEFVAPPWCDELTRYSDAITSEFGGIVYGRVCFEVNRAFWEPSAHDPKSPAAELPFAHKMNSLRKFVFTRTLSGELGWNGVAVRGDLAAEVKRLKEQPGPDLVLFGGAALASALIKIRAIDEYRILLSPMALGGGTPLFQGDYGRFDLELFEAKSYSSGVVMLFYRPKPG